MIAAAVVALVVAERESDGGRGMVREVSSPAASATTPLAAPATPAPPVGNSLVAGAAPVGSLSDVGTADATAPDATDPTLAPHTTTPGRFTLLATGDIMPHRSLLTRLQRTNGSLAIDGAFSDIRPMVSAADLAICHVEGAVLAPGEAIRPSHVLGTPAVWLKEIKRAGYDRCSTASNHSLDGGAAGVDATVEAFARYGLGQSGVAASEATRLPKVFTVNGVRVGHLSYTYGLDHGRLPKGEPWRANIIDPAAIIADAKALRADGAEVVVLSMHWGNTQWRDPSPDQLRWADAITESRQIDLILGSHTHLLQPIDQVNGVWVIWGMSNLLSNHPVNPKWTAATQDGAIFTVEIRRASSGAISVSRPEVHPTWCDKDHGYRVRFAAPGEQADGLPASTVKALKASMQRTRLPLNDYLAPSAR